MFKKMVLFDFRCKYVLFLNQCILPKHKFSISLLNINHLQQLCYNIHSVYGRLSVAAARKIHLRNLNLPMII